MNRPAWVAALVALVAYAVTLGGTYVFDDNFIILTDERVRDPALWGRYWTSDYFDGAIDNLYRPLVSMSYAVQWWLHGDRAWAFHLVNWVLHAGASAAVAALGVRLFRRDLAGYVAGVLFAVHPVHVEAVANIVGRAELACTLAVVGCLLVFVRRPMTVGRALAVWALLAVAVLSKEQGLLLPLLLVLTEFLVVRPRLRETTSSDESETRGARSSGPPLSGDSGDAADPARDRRSRGAMRLLVLLVSWSFAGYLLFREMKLKFWWDRSFLDWTQNPMVRATGSDQWLMPVVLLGRYTQLLVAPWRLSIDYGGIVLGWRARLDDPYLYVGFAAVAAWLVLMGVAAKRRDGALALCLLGLALSYGIVSNFATLIGTNFGERLMYLPSAFFVLVLAAGAIHLRRAVVVPVLAALVLLGGLRTVTYAARWNDRLTFYRQGLAEQPRSIRLHLLLAEELQWRGSYDEAERVMADARALMPGYAQVWVQSAQLALADGRFDDAERYFVEAGRIQPGLFMTMRKLRETIEEAKRAATNAPAATTRAATQRAE